MSRWLPQIGRKRVHNKLSKGEQGGQQQQREDEVSTGVELWIIPLRRDC